MRAFTIEKLRTALRKVSIKRRLNYSIAFLVIVPIIMIVILTHIVFGNAMRKSLRSYSEVITQQLGENMESEVNWLVNCCMELSYSDDFQDMVQNQNKTDWDFLSNYRLVTNSCAVKFENVNYVQQIIYSTLEGRSYSLYGENTYTIQPADEMQGVLAEAGEKNVPYFWYYSRQKEGDGQSIYFVNRVRKLTEGNVCGTMVIELNSRFLQDYYQDMGKSLGEGTKIFTIGPEGVLVSGDQKDYEKTDQEFLLNMLSEETGGSGDVEIDGGKYMGIWSEMQTTGWEVVALIPYSYIDSASNSTSLLILLIGLGVLSLGFIIAAVINSSIVNPLNRILKYTLRLRKGDFTHKIEDQGEDEIRQLADAFNCASDEVNRLMLDVKEQSEQKAQLEFDALQAQINPHFLANTLNTISYLAELRGMGNIKNIAKALINILMVSMGKENKIITIEKEISYVKDYLLIQSYRFPDFYQIDFSIPDDLLRYKIPKFVLQPIVENAVVHGVSKLEGERGKISVEGLLEDKVIHITVKDNGPGISEEKQKELLEGRTEPSGICGLGIKSVDMRLKLLFGQEYGIRIFSRPGDTKIEIVFPAEGGADDENDFDR